ncbi:hypothetical protein A3F00_04285 [Candidatus Daviesbacteria bacterium RIFCSPHIGHO2_12_FULL_37_11]|uniref:Uncharacterized protein n=1 Tax=Candidatus Daviesbacteria bacterium RIFCSPHIGHO2_12_FULL_37_11 TaxID=1797777 RepID=A0A1F5K9L0_9BACT|nr:MAG: hypothetical protein A2769_03455 [Candidatus Daviesbacteria bacterium RIFCSPHIGHO2_01_FULL_37_27]OGE37643.1 MAG: hypothetical protein A3F00_04285 [Candidatus Daviesbacteria bacterium RIFCSPHIGHO2_12_FULL_37_11]OGE45400.1 MAG: hypothetical protein A3B39_04685 [Candidatus Daviesbacteria bacterium RIFCSPLOWO2_01_FULL_37_10]
MSRLPVFTLVLAVILVSSYLIFSRGKNPEIKYKAGKWPEVDVAVNQAQHVYNLRIQTGEDLSNGPCISNALMPGWVVDIVHNPRQEVDNLPENQCSAYLEGKAAHFVELDLEGNVTRVK